MAQSQKPGEMEERFKKEEARFRHAGYVIFFGIAILVFLPLTIGIVSGLVQDRAWDPFTGETVFRESEIDCKQEAGDLIFLAGGSAGLENIWEQRYRRWVARCKAEESGFYDALTVARGRLQGVEATPTLDREPEED